MKPRVLIVGVDWHGDVAQHLSDGFRGLASASVHYAFPQRRSGLLDRIRDEALHLPALGPRARSAQLRAASRRVSRAIEEAEPDLVISLAPDLMTRQNVEDALGVGRAVWWFCDDPFEFGRRGLTERPAVLEYLVESESTSYAAHPGWLRDEVAGGHYLPYASCHDRSPGGSPAKRSSRIVVVSSPRRERVELLSRLGPLLGERLELWGWGRRARWGLMPGSRSVRSHLRGAGTLDRGAVERVFRQAGVVLNLQDAQMLGAWNPQTFDLMGMGIPQVVWNRDPVDLFDNPPPYEEDAEEIASQAVKILDEPESRDWDAGADEVATRHRWANRAETILRGTGVV